MYVPEDSIVYLPGESNDLSRLFRAVADASTEDRDLRITTGVNGEGLSYLMVKVGQGMWSPPIYTHADGPSASTVGSHCKCKVCK